MVRPDRIRPRQRSGFRCIELAGESPVAASTGTPRSRPRAWEEISPSEWGVKSPRRVVRRGGGEQVRRPSVERTLQPREINTRKGRAGRAAHVTAKATDCVSSRIDAGRPRGREDGMRIQVDAEQERPVPGCPGPGQSLGPTSGEGDPYKPTAKAERAGRESEGFIVSKGRLCLPVKPAKAGGEKEPCFGYGRGWR
jgi:hypothetical protein